jgi:hypothetical protein
MSKEEELIALKKELIALEKEVEQLEEILNNKKKKLDEIKNSNSSMSYFFNWMQNQRDKNN